MSDWHGWDGLASITKSHLHGLDGWLDDIANGVDEQFDDSSRKEDLIEMLRALGEEHARFTRMAFSTALHHGNTEAALKRPIEHIAAVIDERSAWAAVRPQGPSSPDTSCPSSSPRAASLTSIGS